MKKQGLNLSKKLETMANKYNISLFGVFLTAMIVVVGASVLFLSQYHPDPIKPPQQITFEQKMAHLETGAPLPGQNTKQQVPRWMMGLILSFIVLQILPLVMAARKSQANKFTQRELRQIEFLAETPLHLGLLGSLFGVCLTQFISGTLSAPLAYLTTISGILLYLLGRFTILVALPTLNSDT